MSNICQAGRVNVFLKIKQTRNNEKKLKANIIFDELGELNS